MNDGTRPLAVALMPLESRRDIILNLAMRADELGYEALFLPETWSHDVLVVLTEVAVRTQRLRLGSGILGIWGRSAAQLAELDDLARSNRIKERLAAIKARRKEEEA